MKNSILVEPGERFKIVFEDPKDNIFIETAAAGKADYIVTQDKHLLKIKEFRKIKIIAPEEFIKLLK